MCLQWGNVPSALWLSGFRADVQNIIVYMACELSIFQDQIPITLKSLAKPWLSSGILDLDTVKKPQLTKRNQKSHSKRTLSCKIVEMDKSAVLS